MIIPSMALCVLFNSPVTLFARGWIISVNTTVSLAFRGSKLNSVGGGEVRDLSDTSQLHCKILRFIQSGGLALLFVAEKPVLVGGQLDGTAARVTLLDGAIKSRITAKFAAVLQIRLLVVGGGPYES